MNIKIKSDPSKIRLHNFMNNPARVIMVSFAMIIALGTIILMLPISSRSGEFTPFTTAFFTATSATCVTGLVVVDTYSYFSTFGQSIILALIQLGGLGLVTFTTFFNIIIRKRLGLKDLYLAQESINSGSMAGVSKLIKMIITFTFTVELIGAVLLGLVFVPQFGAEGVFISVFLAISAFCNAGFDVLGRIEEFTSLTPYAENSYLLIVIMVLIICGGFGFIAWHDLKNYFTTKKLMLHTKIVLLTTVILVSFGALFILLSEWNNPNTIGNMSVFDKIINSLFLSVSCRTAGFNTFDIQSMNGVTKLFSIMLMFIGAAPGSTGGGIKVTTFVVIIMTVVSVIRGRSDTSILGRSVQKSVVYKSLTVTIIGFFAVMITTAVVSTGVHTDVVQIDDINALFESVSAFATVGLSAGATSAVTLFPLMMLALTMFMGRVGPVSIALSLSMRNNDIKNQIIPEGKIMVG